MPNEFNPGELYLKSISFLSHSQYSVYFNSALLYTLGCSKEFPKLTLDLFRVITENFNSFNNQIKSNFLRFCSNFTKNIFTNNYSINEANQMLQSMLTISKCCIDNNLLMMDLEKFWNSIIMNNNNNEKDENLKLIYSFLLNKLTDELNKNKDLKIKENESESEQKSGSQSQSESENESGSESESGSGSGSGSESESESESDQESDSDNNESDNNESDSSAKSETENSDKEIPLPDELPEELPDELPGIETEDLPQDLIKQEIEIEMENDQKEKENNSEKQIEKKDKKAKEKEKEKEKEIDENYILVIKNIYLILSRKNPELSISFLCKQLTQYENPPNDLREFIQWVNIKNDNINIHQNSSLILLEDLVLENNLIINKCLPILLHYGLILRTNETENKRINNAQKEIFRNLINSIEIKPNINHKTQNTEIDDLIQNDNTNLNFEKINKLIDFFTPYNENLRNYWSELSLSMAFKSGIVDYSKYSIKIFSMLSNSFNDTTFKKIILGSSILLNQRIELVQYLIEFLNNNINDDNLSNNKNNTKYLIYFLNLLLFVNNEKIYNDSIDLFLKLITKMKMNNLDINDILNSINEIWLFNFEEKDNQLINTKRHIWNEKIKILEYYANDDDEEDQEKQNEKDNTTKSGDDEDDKEDDEDDSENEKDNEDDEDDDDDEDDEDKKKKKKKRKRKSKKKKRGKGKTKKKFKPLQKKVEPTIQEIVNQVLDNLNTFKQRERGIEDNNNSKKIAFDLGIARICWKGFSRIESFEKNLNLFGTFVTIYSNNCPSVNNYCFSATMIAYLIKYLLNSNKQQIILELEKLSQTSKNDYLLIIQKFIQIFNLSNENAILIAFWKLFQTCFNGLGQFSFILDALLTLLLEFENETHPIIVSTLKILPYFLSSYRFPLSIQDFTNLKNVLQYFAYIQSSEISYHSNRTLAILISHPPNINEDNYLHHLSVKQSKKEIIKSYGKLGNSRITKFFTKKSEISQSYYQNALKLFINYILLK
ncbi:heat shock protein [Anaeramoeba flamelloides]|uniref:Heat shock protein n=1 Tax=Anaeramoeba flamelloides TaxID=1746091 RepID=A0AAV8A3G2_9EUKA|nr:heat shock protein [Anaeramoeba flamelloides]